MTATAKVAEEPVASRGKGKEVTVQVRSGMEAKELGELDRKSVV